jgi:hypothetical protein
MDHPGNIVITRRIANIGHLAAFDSLPYAERRRSLEEHGYKVELPITQLTAAWARRQRGSIKDLAITRWGIPENGLITKETWPRDIQLVFEDLPEDPED